MQGIIQRLRYARFIFMPATWRWMVSRMDSVVEDHLLPWSEVRRAGRSVVHPSVSMRNARNIEIGTWTRIQQHCVLWASPNSKIRIGSHSGLGPGTLIFSSNHRFEPGTPYHLQGWNEADVTIGEDVWVGAGSVIVAGVTIGDRCVVAAGSVVTKDIPPDSVAAGVPARVLKTRPTTK